MATPLLAIAHLAVLPGIRLQGENELGAIYFSKLASVNSNNLCRDSRRNRLIKLCQNWLSHLFLINDFRRILIGARAVRSC